MAPLVWATEETKLWYLHLWNSAKILVLAPPVYQDLSMCHNWPVQQATVDLPINMKGN